MPPRLTPGSFVPETHAEGRHVSCQLLSPGRIEVGKMILPAGAAHGVTNYERRYSVGHSAMRSGPYLVIIGLALVLGACRETEQNRPLFHTPGTYSGPVDEKLNEQQLEDLRARAQNMRGV